MSTLLLIAHPGHELRVLQWVALNRPEVVMLTHGDGSIGQPRLADSLAVLTALGVRLRADWISAVSDQAIYQALLGQGPSPLDGWLERLSERALAAGVTTVVADEAEGYNPTHELCRVLANRLCERLRRGGHEVDNLEVPLVGHPCDPARRAQMRVEVTLSPAQAAWKIGQMCDYARRCSPVLEAEVRKMLDDFGAEAFATECLYAARRTVYEDDRLPDEKPAFERFGEARHAAGIYPHVIRAEHLRQLVRRMHVAR